MNETGPRLPPAEAFYATQALSDHEVWLRVLAAVGGRTDQGWYRDRAVCTAQQAGFLGLDRAKCPCGKGEVAADWTSGLSVDLSLRGSDLDIGNVDQDRWERPQRDRSLAYAGWRDQRVEFYMLREKVSVYSIVIATLGSDPAWTPIFRALRKRRERQVRRERWEWRQEHSHLVEKQAMAALGRGR